MRISYAAKRYGANVFVLVTREKEQTVNVWCVIKMNLFECMVLQRLNQWHSSSQLTTTERELNVRIFIVCIIDSKRIDFVCLIHASFCCVRPYNGSIYMRQSSQFECLETRIACE